MVLVADVLDWTGYPVELTGANYRLMDQQGRHYRVTATAKPNGSTCCRRQRPSWCWKGRKGCWPAFPRAAIEIIVADPATLLEAIQAAWAADAVLSGLVPDVRCYFGKVPPLASEAAHRR